jgi:hypothetical protein
MATVFFQEEHPMYAEHNMQDDDRKVIIIERDSGIGWAAAFIVLAIAIGFGVIVFMDQQSMIEYKIEVALQKMYDRGLPDANDLPEIQIPGRDGLMPTTKNAVLDSDSGAEMKFSGQDRSRRSASIRDEFTR